MGRSAKICRSVSYEKVKKVKKGQVWRQSGAQVIRQEQKASKASQETQMQEPHESTTRTTRRD